MSDFTKILNMQDVEKMMRYAMVQMQKGESYAARMILVDCLTFVKTFDQLSVHCRNDVVEPELIAVPLGKPLYEEGCTSKRRKHNNSTLTDRQDGFYFSAYYISDGLRYSNIDVVTLTAVLLYNIAITYHKEGLFDGRSTSYQKALYTYKSILKLMKQKSDKTESATNTELSQATLRIIVIVCHNMGHIYKESCDFVLYRRLIDIGSRVAHTIHDEMMPTTDREFFALNQFFATMSERCCAQAA